MESREQDVVNIQKGNKIGRFTVIKEAFVITQDLVEPFDLGVGVFVKVCLK